MTRAGLLKRESIKEMVVTKHFRCSLFFRKLLAVWDIPGRGATGIFLVTGLGHFHQLLGRLTISPADLVLLGNRLKHEGK